MIKHNSKVLATYVSPAIKVAQLNPRRVMCTSPYGQNGMAGGVFDPYNTNDYSDDESLL